MTLAKTTAALAVLLVLTGCSATRLRDAWSDPAARQLGAGDTFLAVAISDRPLVRRAAEDELVRRIGATRAQASYVLLGETDLGDEAAAREKVRAAGIDYAVVLRPVTSRQETTWIPGRISTYPVAYRTFWGYYGVGWRAYEDPGYARTDTIVEVEVLLFSLADDKVVWAARAETSNPSDVEKVVREIAAASARDLEKRGLLSRR